MRRLSILILVLALVALNAAFIPAGVAAQDATPDAGRDTRSARRRTAGSSRARPTSCSRCSAWRRGGQAAPAAAHARAGAALDRGR